MTKFPKMKYPWASIDFTQAEGVYCLHITLSEAVSIEVALGDSDLDYLELEIKTMREHLAHLKQVREEAGQT